MANITLLGASYTDVPAVTLPQTGGGTVTFYENGGGGSGYTRTVIAPQQTVTPDSNRQATLSGVTDGFVDAAHYIVTLDGVEWYGTCETLWGTNLTVGEVQWFWSTPGSYVYPFGAIYISGEGLSVAFADTNQHTVKIEKLELNGSGGGGSATLITKSITANGTYSASDDSADGYSEVTVNVPSGSGSDFPKFTVVHDPSTGVRVSGVCDKTFAQCLDYIDAGKTYGELTEVWDASYSAYGTVTWFDQGDDYVIYTAMNGTYPMYDIRYNSDGTIVFTEPSANNVVLNITQNGTTYPTGVVTEVNVNVPLNVNVQTVQSTTRRNNTALGSITSLTCSTAGTYDVYWTCARSNTSQTWGSQLYINGTAYGTEKTAWSNHVQNNLLTGVVLSANDTVAVYGRSRSGYYIYVPQLTIVQTA